MQVWSSIALSVASVFGVQALQTEPGVKLAWSDIDADGQRDVFVVHPAGESRLLVGAGDGRFDPATAEHGLGEVGDTRAAAWIDADGDGREDLLLAGPRGVRLMNNQGGTFAERTPGAFAGLTVQGVEVLDFDGDARPDLSLQSERETVLFRNVGGGAFERTELSIGTSRPAPLGGARESGEGLGAENGAGSPGGEEAKGRGRSLLERERVGRRDSAERQPAGSGGTPSISSSRRPVAPNGGGTNNAGLSGACSNYIRDTVTNICIEASSNPVLGTIYPLGLAFCITPAEWVGFGTTTPLDKMHVIGNFPAIRLEDPSVGGSYSRIQDGENGLGITKVSGGAGSFIDFDPQSTNNQTSYVRFFRSTDTTGVKRVIFNKGDGTAASHAQIGVDGADSFFQMGGGDVGIGTSVPQAKLHVKGTTSVDGRVTVTDKLVNDVVIFGTNSDVSSTNAGIAGVSMSSNGQGVVGSVPSTFGATTGVAGVSASSGGTGVNGRSPYIGVHGISSNTSGSGYGVRAEASSKSGRAVFATNHSTSGVTFGVYSEAMADQSRAVYGLASATSGVNYGVYGASSSVSGRGVYGLATSTTGDVRGIQGFAQSSSGYAGHFRNQSSGVAVWAENTGIGDSDNILVAANPGDMEFRVSALGNAFCDGAFSGGGADYAEWLERADANETFAPGDVVGVFGGRISKRIEGAQQILAISTNPVLIGNSADADQNTREGYEKVAFLGQVPVKVRGRAAVGDFIRASQNGDGTAYALSPSEVASHDLPYILGTAWEASDASGLATINVAIGVDQRAASAVVIANLERELAQTRDRFEGRLAALEAAIAPAVADRR